MDFEGTTRGLGLRSTMLIAAFEGWNDAGSAATNALAHLGETWDAEKAAELDSENYHDFQVNRPYVGPGPSGKREIFWPTSSFWEANVSGRRVILLHGVEPSFRWRSYCEEVLDVADVHGVDTVITLGALLADVPHTRPIPLTATTESDSLRAIMTDVEPNTYEGPTGIVGVLQHAAAARGFQAISLWAAVPHYVGGSPSPKATLALLLRISELLEEPIDPGDLPDESAAWQSDIDETLAGDDEILEYISELEAARDTADSPEASGEAIAREFERWLSRGGDQDPRPGH